MINLCTATSIQHWFSKFFKFFETSRKFRVFVFRYRATNKNAELEENKIRVIFHWENLWEGIRISSGIILRLFYQRRKEIMIFPGFRQYRQFRGIDLMSKTPNYTNWKRRSLHSVLRWAYFMARSFLKFLKLSTWPIKASVVNSVFSSVGECALSSLLKMVTSTNIFHHFFLRFP